MKRIFYITSFVVFVFVLVFTNNISAQNTPEKLMDQFFILFEKNPGSAFDYIFSTNKMIDQNQPEIHGLKDSFDRSRKMLGNYYGYTVAKKMVIADVYVKYYYVLRYERLPLKLEAIMYKPNDTWKIQSITCKEVLDDFKEVE